SLSLFLQRIFVRGTDYRLIHDPAALARHRRGRKKARQWNQGWFSLRRQRQTKPCNDRAHRSNHLFHFPDHYGDDAVVRATGAAPWRGSTGFFNGRIGSWLSDRGNFPDQHSASKTCDCDDGKRLRRRLRHFQFIERAKLLRRDRVTYSEFAWVGHELRLGEHNCTGAGDLLS